VFIFWPQRFGITLSRPAISRQTSSVAPLAVTKSCKSERTDVRFTHAQGSTNPFAIMNPFVILIGVFAVVFITTLLTRKGRMQRSARPGGVDTCQTDGGVESSGGFWGALLGDSGIPDSDSSGNTPQSHHQHHHHHTPGNADLPLEAPDPQHHHAGSGDIGS